MTLFPAALHACAPQPAVERSEPDRPVFDPTSQPPSNEIMPRAGALLDGAPQTLDVARISGAWHSGDCRLAFAGSGLSGQVQAGGTCPDGISRVTGWRIESEHRQRLSLTGRDGTEVWAGVLRRDDTLAGVARGHGGMIFIR